MDERGDERRTDEAKGETAKPAARIGGVATPRPFAWGPFILGLFAGSGASLLVALPLDAALIGFGVPLHPWRDALWSAFFGLVFAGPGILAVWRIGITTLPQYILGSMILFAPLTVISLLIANVVDDMVLTAPWAPGEEISAHDLAYTAYVRIARSAVLVFPFLIGFCAVYHWRFGCAARVPR
ncbi:MAG: hypothetical protein AAGF90_14665 [Pseudomonadota bacterium]